MGTNTQRNMQWVVASATLLAIIGVGLNIAVMQTLGSFDAASVILALFLGFWAFVLGSMGLLVSSIWLFMKRKDLVAEPTRSTPEAVQPVGLHALGHRQRCMAS